MVKLPKNQEGKSAILAPERAYKTRKILHMCFISENEEKNRG